LSIIHDALKRAESEKRPRGSSLASQRYGPGQSGAKRQLWQVFVSIGALCLGFAALVAAISLLVYSRGHDSSTPELASREGDVVAAESLPRTRWDASGREREASVAPGPERLADPRGAQGLAAARQPAPESRKAEPTLPGVDAKEPEDGAKSLSISMSQDELVVSRSEPAEPRKKGKIDIRSVGRFKTELELRRERQARCLTHLGEAQRLANNGKTELAGEQFEKALATEPENELALLAFGSFLLSTNRPVLAERYLRRGIAVERATKEIKSLLYANLGLSLFEQGLFEDAVKAYQAAIAINDGNLNAYNNLAIAYKRLGKKELAKRTFSRLLVVETKSPMAYYGLGMLNDEDGKLDEAIFHYSRFLVLAGRHYDDLQESVKRRVDALKAKRESKKKRKFVRKESYIP